MIKKLFMLARDGLLRKGFNLWELADKNGWTVAHEAAKYGRLPKGFDQWELTDKDGWTVAHAAARYGHLPETFDRWELADKSGTTVAQVAAKRSDLSKASDQWEPDDPYRGLTVCCNCPSVNTLPEGFEEWARADDEGRAVEEAAEAAGKGRGRDERDERE
jgi:hypothetical protein